MASISYKQKAQDMIWLHRYQHDKTEFYTHITTYIY
jgi:hypothetical protein